MGSRKTLTLPGFELRIKKCEFSQPAVGNPDELINPLASSTPLNPEYALQRQLKWMQDEINAYAAGIDTLALGNGPAVHIGIDSEWQFIPEQNRNRVLSYQFHLFSPLGEIAGMLYPKVPDRRVQFENFLGLILQLAMHSEVIEAWPFKVYVYAHFLRADMTHFDSFWANKRKVDGMRGTIASVTGDYEADWIDESKRYRPGPLVLRDEYRHPRRTLVRFVDTLLLTPGNLGLDAAGELIGVDKLVLPAGYDKSEMGRLLAERPEDFETYALKDAEIAVRYGLKVREFVSEEIGLNKLPPTIGSLAASLCRKLLRDEHGDEDAFLSIFGKERQNIRSYWHDTKGRPQHVSQVTLSVGREYREAFVTKCYLGGRNECLWLGPTELSDFHDYDLVGAYTTGLLDLRALDYDLAYDCKNPAEYVGHACGFAQVEFAFPAQVRFPCLPVRHEERGLYYPQCGVSFCTAPEIALALAMGAELTIKFGFIVPWKTGDARIMQPFIKRVRERRQHYKALKQVFEEKLWKEIGNSVYGKTAQGLRDKSSFDPRTGRGKTIPTSALTNPYFAAHVTGFIRAVVSEIMARVPTDRQIISVTTDGFLTDAEAHEIDLSGPLARRFQSLIERLDGHSAGKVASMLERKHRVRQLIAMKTRGQLTAEPYPGFEPVLAKAGIKPPMADKSRHNQYMLELYLNRAVRQKHATQHLISMQEQWQTESDLVEIKRDQFLNLEFDFKRRPVNPKMVEVAGHVHLTCNTEAWKTASQAELARTIFDGWRKSHCLKTVNDFEAWEEFYAAQLSIRGTGIKMTAEGTVGLLRRLFLRAYTQGIWGTEKVLSYAKLADWLTDQGYPTTETEVKNAGRSKLVEHCVPPTIKVEALLKQLLELQPNLEVERFLAP